MQKKIIYTFYERKKVLVLKNNFIVGFILIYNIDIFSGRISDEDYNLISKSKLNQFYLISAKLIVTETRGKKNKMVLTYVNNI